MRHPRPLRAPPLGPGARVALVAPGGPVKEEVIPAAIAECDAFGFEPVLGAAARRRLGYLAGPDAERAADLDRAFRDPGIHAVWALRGGYGTLRLLEALDLEPLRHRPRPFIGFSDNTALHLALSRLGVVSFHGPHAGGVLTDFSRACLRDVLCSGGAPGRLPPAPDGEPVTALVDGVADGRLAGGNLSMLAAACGTPWSLRAAGCIVFIEDVSEATYRIDRALMQLRLAGALDGAAGIVFGRFTERPEPGNDRPLAEVLTELVRPLGVPALLGAPIGHIDAQWTLPVGARARMDAGSGSLELLEPGVGPGEDA